MFPVEAPKPATTYPIEAERPDIGVYQNCRPILTRPLIFRPFLLYDTGGGLWWLNMEGDYDPGDNTQLGWL